MSSQAAVIKRTAARGAALAIGRRSVHAAGEPVVVDADRRHLRTMLLVISVAAFGIGLPLALVYVNRGAPDQLVGSIGLVVVGIGALVARRAVNDTNQARVVECVSLGLLLFTSLTSLAGNHNATLALTNLVAVVIAVPYVDRRALRTLSLAAFGASAVVGYSFATSGPATDASGAPEALMRFLGVCVNAGIGLFAVVHVSGRLTAAVQRYRDLFQRVPLGMYRTTPEGHFLDANEAFAEMFGMPCDQLQSINALELYADAADRASFRAAIDNAGVGRRIEFRARRLDGREFWVRDNALLVRDGYGRPLYYEGILEDVTEHKRHEQKLQERASVDALTGLANRAVLWDRLEELAHEASPDTVVALLFVDLDDFKQVNDRFGHAAGDASLVEAARRLRGATRDSDLVARFGGDEFAVLLGVPASADVARAVARRIVDAFRAPLKVGADSIVIGASVGIAVAAEQFAAAELIRRADQAMYAAKNQEKIATFSG